jgi:phage/plasmid-like protein (TIGR03299 family)
MGMETTEWYNNMILVGYENQRGKAWHYKKEAQGDEPNHYEGAIPADDIMRRLFNFNVIEKPVFIQVPATVEDMSGIDANGDPFKFQQIERKAIVTDDDHSLMEVFKNGYKPHQFSQLLDITANLIDDDINYGSAGLLNDRKRAWVSLEMPESVTVLEGFEIRPFLLATTSHDGSLSTTFKQVNTFVVCDNTHEIAMGEQGHAYKARHSKYSSLKITSVREALGIVQSLTDTTIAEIQSLASWKVSDADFTRLLDAVVPIPQGDDAPAIAVTKATNKRADILNLYRDDERVSPWAGSALGVLQAFNTFNHHVAGTDKNRIERNMMNTISGKTAKADRNIVQVLAGITG